MNFLIFFSCENNSKPNESLSPIGLIPRIFFAFHLKVVGDIFVFMKNVLLLYLAKVAPRPICLTP